MDRKLLFLAHLFSLLLIKVESQSGLEFIATSPYIVKLANMLISSELKNCTYTIRGTKGLFISQNYACGMVSLPVEPGDFYEIAVFDQNNDTIGTTTAFSLTKEPKISQIGYYENEILYISWENQETSYAYFSTVKLDILSKESKSVLLYNKTINVGINFSLVDGLHKGDICALEVCHVLNSTICDEKVIGNCSSCTNKLLFIDDLDKKTLISLDVIHGNQNSLNLHFKIPEHIKLNKLTCYIVTSSSLKKKTGKKVNFKDVHHLLLTLGNDWNIAAMLNDYECKNTKYFVLGDKRYLYGYKNSPIIKGTYISAMLAVCDKQQCYESSFSDSTISSAENLYIIIPVCIISLIFSFIFLALLIKYSQDVPKLNIQLNVRSEYQNAKYATSSIHNYVEDINTVLNSFPVSSDYDLQNTPKNRYSKVLLPGRPTLASRDGLRPSYETIDIRNRRITLNSTENLENNENYSSKSMDRNKGYGRDIGSLIGNSRSVETLKSDYTNESPNEKNIGLKVGFENSRSVETLKSGYSNESTNEKHIGLQAGFENSIPIKTLKTKDKNESTNTKDSLETGYGNSRPVETLKSGYSNESPNEKHIGLQVGYSDSRPVKTLKTKDKNKSTNTKDNLEAGYGNSRPVETLKTKDNNKSSNTKGSLETGYENSRSVETLKSDYSNELPNKKNIGLQSGYGNSRSVEMLKTKDNESTNTKGSLEAGYGNSRTTGVQYSNTIGSNLKPKSSPYENDSLGQNGNNATGSKHEIASKLNDAQQNENSKSEVTKPGYDAVLLTGKLKKKTDNKLFSRVKFSKSKALLKKHSNTGNFDDKTPKKDKQNEDPETRKP